MCYSGLDQVIILSSDISMIHDPFSSPTGIGTVVSYLGFPSLLLSLPKIYFFLHLLIKIDKLFQEKIESEFSSELNYH